MTDSKTSKEERYINWIGISPFFFGGAMLIFGMLDMWVINFMSEQFDLFMVIFGSLVLTVITLLTIVELRM